MDVMMEWQPIETAPMRGTEILLWAPKFDGPYYGRYEGKDWWVPDDPLNKPWTQLITPPTHWMPLPEPPLDKETEETEE